jgi:hypothetical protein
MMIKVYQIQLTNAEIDMINSGQTSDRIKAYFDRNFEGTFKAENFQYYTHVATVDTRDLEEAFECMNLWHNDKVQKVTSTVSSMSVGDILESNGQLYRCASFGFTLLENYQKD